MAPNYRINPAAGMGCSSRIVGPRAPDAGYPVRSALCADV